MLTFSGNDEKKTKQVYVIEIKDFHGTTVHAPTKVFLNEKTAENRKDELLNVFHDIKAKVVPVELVE